MSSESEPELAQAPVPATQLTSNSNTTTQIICKNPMGGTSTNADELRKFSNMVPLVLEGTDLTLYLTRESVCSDVERMNSVIKLLQSEQKLPENFKPNTELICNNPTISTYYESFAFAGMGSYNVSFLVNPAPDTSYILRLTKTHKLDKKRDLIELTQSELDDELAGIFMQSVLQTKCKDHICNVYDFGYYTHFESDGEGEGGGTIKGVYAILEVLNTTVDLAIDIRNKPHHIGILTALDCIHSNGYVHMDIKPDNIGISIDGNNIKLFDFGFCRHLSNPCVEHDGLWGTYPYHDYDQFCFTNDVYSFGIILVQNLTPAKDTMTKFSKHVAACIQEIIRRRPDLDDIIKCNRNAVNKLVEHEKDADPYKKCILDLIKTIINADAKSRLSAKECVQHLNSCISPSTKTNFNFKTQFFVWAQLIQNDKSTPYLVKAISDGNKLGKVKITKSEDTPPNELIKFYTNYTKPKRPLFLTIDKYGSFKVDNDPVYLESVILFGGKKTRARREHSKRISNKPRHRKRAHVSKKSKKMRRRKTKRAR